MKKTISITELENSIRIREVFEDIRLNNTTYVVRENEKTLGVIMSIEDYNEYKALIKDEVFALEQKLKTNIAISETDYDFLVKHAGYDEKEKCIYCNQ